MYTLCYNKVYIFYGEIMIGQHHRVGEKTFVGPYAGLYESANTQLFSQYIVPNYHLDRFLSVDVEKLANYTTQDLIRKKLNK